MKIKFIGVGEAVDEKLPNTSIQVVVEENSDWHCILLDCGPTVPPPFLRSCPDPERLEAIWISHFHGDHFFGLPALLLRFQEMKRKKPLAIIGQQGIAEIVQKTVGLAYPSLLSKLCFELNFISVEPGQVLNCAAVSWRCALNAHLRRNLAVRIEKAGKSLFYNGDGPPTEETLSLARGADLAIHEAFRIDNAIPGHSTILECIDFGRKAHVSRLALVHMERNERRLRRGEISRLIHSVCDTEVFLPEPGEETLI
ncbi:MAG: MBL fold metallo-hydrolase [Syntrophobacteraceae bacterium]